MRPINRFRLRVASVLALLLGFTSPVAFAETTFTFQGRLGSAGMPANGSHDFEFRLFDAESGGTQVSGDLTREDVAVTDGIFTVQLDFGTSPYDSSPRWLDVDVREAGGGAFTTLDTRFRIGTAPFAIEALAIAPGAVDTGAIQDGAVTRQKLANNAVDTAVIADGTVTTNDIRDNNITSPKFDEGAVDSRAIAPGAIGTAEIITSQVQRRVAGTCEAGTYLSGIAEDGGVICDVLPLGLTRTLDSADDVGDFTSIAIRDNGLPVISYWDATNDDLKLFDCSNVACSSGTARTLDGGGVSDVGWYTSIAIRDNGRPVISYYDLTNFDLKLLDCSNVACSGGTARRLDSAGDVGRYATIAIRDNGLPVISYRDDTNLDLKLFDCSNVACSSGIARTLDGGVSNVGLHTSIAIRDNGLPVISYRDDTNLDLKLFDCSNVACSSGTARTLDSAGNVGRYTSIAIRDNGLPVISYYNDTSDDLNLFDCSNVACSSGIARTLDSAGDVGEYTSIAIRDNGLPVISYWDATNLDLKLFDCSNVACFSGSARTLDSAGNVGAFASIAIRDNGLPVISYWDATNDDLKLYSCGDERCEN